MNTYTKFAVAVLFVFVAISCEQPTDNATPTNEGTSSSPVQLGTPPINYSASVGSSDADGRAYYRVLLTGGTNYQVSISGTTSDIDLYYYQSENFQNLVTSSIGTTGEETVSITVGGTTSDQTYDYIRVDNFDGAATNFTLKIEKTS